MTNLQIRHAQRSEFPIRTAGGVLGCPRWAACPRSTGWGGASAGKSLQPAAEASTQEKTLGNAAQMLMLPDMRAQRKTTIPAALILAGSLVIANQSHAQVVNGNFSSGNTGFTSGYGFAASSDPGGGHFTIGTNPHTWNSFLSSFGDHTTGSGQMYIADGSSTANLQLWNESLSVATNTDYTFSFYAASCGNDNNNGIDPSPATLVVKANGTQIGTTLHVSATNGTWTQFTGTFNSGALTSIPLVITDSNLQGGVGNDFAIDDITVTATPEPGSAGLVLCGAGVLSFRRRRQGAGSAR